MCSDNGYTAAPRPFCPGTRSAVRTLCAVDALAHVEPFKQRVLIWMDLGGTLNLKVGLWRAVNGQFVICQLVSGACKWLPIELQRCELHVVPSIQAHRPICGVRVLDEPVEHVQAVTHTSDAHMQWLSQTALSQTFMRYRFTHGMLNRSHRSFDTTVVYSRRKSKSRSICVSGRRSQCSVLTQPLYQWALHREKPRYDEGPGGVCAAVLSHVIWRKASGGSPVCSSPFGAWLSRRSRSQLRLHKSVHEHAAVELLVRELLGKRSASDLLEQVLHAALSFHGGRSAGRERHC